MRPILIEWSNQTNWLMFVLPPFSFWLMTGVGLLGFSPVLRRLSPDRNLFQKDKLGLKRANFYKCEILLTAISLTIFTYIYHLLLVLGRNHSEGPV